MKKIITTVILLGVALIGATRLFSDVDPSLQEKMGGLFSSFSADFSYGSDEGGIYQGKIHYEYPDKMHIKLNDGRVIATNGVYLWLYSPESMKCARQKVQEGKNGILNILQPQYLVSSNEKEYLFQHEGAYISEAVVEVRDQMIKNARLKVGEKYITLSFSKVEVNIGMKASLFNYKPPTDAQLVENPLNKVAHPNSGM